MSFNHTSAQGDEHLEKITCQTCGGNEIANAECNHCGTKYSSGGIENNLDFGKGSETQPQDSVSDIIKKNIGAIILGTSLGISSVGIYKALENDDGINNFDNIALPSIPLQGNRENMFNRNITGISNDIDLMINGNITGTSNDVNIMIGGNITGVSNNVNVMIGGKIDGTSNSIQKGYQVELTGVSNDIHQHLSQEQAQSILQKMGFSKSDIIAIMK